MKTDTITEVVEEPALQIVVGAIETCRAATLSRCRRYRYSLTRTWDTDLPTVAFVGLNPSTADARRDDPTVRRCVGFARDWGYGTLILVNLFAFRATDPSELLDVRDPVGPENDDWLARVAESADKVVAAWGVHGCLRGRDQAVLGLLPSVACLGRTREGHPRHPLYLARTTGLEAF